MSAMNETAIKLAVLDRYTQAATTGCCGEDCCGGAQAGTLEPVEVAGACCVSGCCGDTAGVEDFAPDIPSLGCGTPVDAAALRAGETVVDLGSGRGLDAFRAADRVGPAGNVIGVDMTPTMVWKAREDAHRLDFRQVEFRLGEIEMLPLPAQSADVVISNCVINLVPDKDRAFAEAFRVLRPGGRLVVSDIVRSEATGAADPDLSAWAACLAGAEEERAYLGRITGAGFTALEVLARTGGGYRSITVRAFRPALAERSLPQPS